jgi:hypothetical protein
MTPGERAETRIAELGITDPRDIDVDAIAYDARMLVEYEALEGCEAMLVGAGDRAIATVRPSSIRGRERFSVGHELGHWEMQLPERLHRLQPAPLLGGDVDGGGGQRGMAQVLLRDLDGHAAGDGMAGMGVAHPVRAGAQEAVGTAGIAFGLQHLRAVAKKALIWS